MTRIDHLARRLTQSACSSSGRTFSSADGAAMQPFALQLASLGGSRAVISVKGSGVLPFLQGLVTADVRPLANRPGLVYAALLTSKGKFMHDCMIYNQGDSSQGGGKAGDPGALLLDVHAPSKQRLLDWLSRYKLRKPIALEDASSELTAWQTWGSDPNPSTAPSIPAAGWHPDPRHPGLGCRGVFAAQPAVGGAAVCEASDFMARRIALGIAEGDAEIPSEKAVPQEFNLDQLGCVSYTKGCYVGQERQAHTHYRGVIRRRLMPVVLRPAAGSSEGASAAAAGAVPAPAESAGGAPAEADEVCVHFPGADGTMGESVGTLRAVAGGAALAHLQLGPALKAIEGGFQLAVKGKATAVEPRCPDWWPQEWREITAELGGAK